MCSGVLTRWFLFTTFCYYICFIFLHCCYDPDSTPRWLNLSLIHPLCQPLPQPQTVASHHHYLRGSHPPRASQQYQVSPVVSLCAGPRTLHGYWEAAPPHVLPYCLPGQAGRPSFLCGPGHMGSLLLACAYAPLPYDPGPSCGF